MLNFNRNTLDRSLHTPCLGYTGKACDVELNQTLDSYGIDLPTPCCSPVNDQHRGRKTCGKIVLLVTNVDSDPKCRAINEVCSLFHNTLVFSRCF